MNVVQGRHAFWNVPRPMLTNGPYRTVPLSLGRQFIGFGNPFLGQDQTSLPAPVSLNRLDNLNVSTILNRIMVAPPFLRLTAAIATPAPKPQGLPFGGGNQGGREDTPEDKVTTLLLQSDLSLPSLTDDEKTVLTLISLNPTPEELDDLATIDGFFGVSNTTPNQATAQPALTPGVCADLKSNRIPVLDDLGIGNGMGLLGRMRVNVADILVAWLTYAPPAGRGLFAAPAGPPNATSDEIDAIKNSSFFCETPKGYPDIVYWGGKGNYGGWFGIDPNQTWGDIKLQVQNAITVMDVVAGYPFPPPIDQYAAQFWVSANADIHTLITMGSALDPAAVEYWVTLFTVSNYNAMVDAIQANLKKEAKRDKRHAMMQVIGLAIASIVVAYLAPAIIVVAVSVIKTAVQTYIQIQQRKEAAKGMADTAKLFEKDAPAFSAKVNDAASMLDQTTALQEAAATPSPDLQAAIDEVPGPATVSPLVPIGGIAAAGLAALLIFR